MGSLACFRQFATREVNLAINDSRSNFCIAFKKFSHLAFLETVSVYQLCGRRNYYQAVRSDSFIRELMQIFIVRESFKLGVKKE